MRPTPVLRRWPWWLAEASISLIAFFAACLGVAAMLLVTGCGAVTGQSSSTPLPLPSPPTAAVAKWSSFPADANPRPAILFGDVVDQIGPGQFPDNDSKLTWVCNKFVLASDLQLTSAGPAVATARA